MNKLIWTKIETNKIEVNELTWKKWNEETEANELTWTKLKWMNWREQIEIQKLQWMNWNEWLDMNELKWNEIKELKGRNWYEWIEVKEWCGWHDDDFADVIFQECPKSNNFLRSLCEVSACWSPARFLLTPFPDWAARPRKQRPSFGDHGSHISRTKNAGFRARECFQAEFTRSWSLTLLNYLMTMCLLWW